ncbi:MAG: hypothetical protein KKB45_09880 [Gammaproteobacteria bacterium]|nr:hypothetical protein [Gammaproteobacteria bacterium]
MPRQFSDFNRRMMKWSVPVCLVGCCLIIFLTTISRDTSLRVSDDSKPNSQSIFATPIDVAAAVTPKNTMPQVESPGTAASNQSGQMIVVQRPDWALEGQLRTHFDRLQTLAAQGDHQAAYILAMNLRSCFYVPANDIDFEEKLQQVHRFKDSSEAVTSITERFHFCQGVDENQRGQFYRYLEAAADNGFVPAQEEMASVTPELFLNLTGAAQLERAGYIKKRDEFVQQQIGWLGSAAQHGSILALMRLSNMGYSQNYHHHQSQQYGALNRVQSYAFNQLILEIADDNDVYSRYARYQQNLQAQLTPEEIEQASRMAEDWLTIITANGTLYLDD